MLPDLDTAERITQMLRDFYGEVLKNEVLRPYFADIDMEAHLPVISAFWEQLLLGTGHYEGNPMKVHQHLHGKIPLTEAAFENWLKLFLENLDRNWSGPHTELARQRAMSIATTFRLKFIYGGIGPAKA